jgi:hypothetical protein
MPAHSYLSGSPPKVRDEPSQIAGSTVALDSKLFRFLNEIYTNSDRDCHIEELSRSFGDDHAPRLAEQRRA